MKIIVCGSMTVSKEMIDVRNELHSLKHEVVLPAYTDDYAKLDSIESMHVESAQNKVRDDLIRGYFEIIKEGDAVLIVNVERKGISGYIGGNTFLEMAFAYILHKPIYVLHPLPDLSYTDEINAMEPIILNGNIKLL